jgi:hypothetical protein
MSKKQILQSDVIDGITDPNKLPHKNDKYLVAPAPGFCPYLGNNYPPKTPLVYGGVHYRCDPLGSGQWTPI